MSEISIRALLEEDYEAFAKLRAIGLETDPASFWNTVAEEAPELRDKFQHRALEQHNFIIGAFASEKLVGMMAFVRYPLVKLRHKGDIHGVYVHADYRGKGIASRLLAKTLENAFAQDGITKVMLTVTEGNEAAKSLYEKYGFKTFGLEEAGMVVNGKVYGQYWMQLTRAAWEA